MYAYPFLRHRLRRCILELQWKSHRKHRAFPGPAFYSDITVHQIYQILCDSHSQSGTGYPAVCGVLGPLKGLEQFAHKFTAHADPSVSAPEHITPISSAGALLLPYLHMNAPPFRGVFGRIAQDINIYLADTQGISHHFLIFQPLQMYVHLKVFGLCLRTHQLRGFRHQFCQVKGFLPYG